jgi:hypothetical protein
MNKSVIKKYSSVYLSTVLVAGIFAISSLSFMMESQAEQEYGLDNHMKKVIVEKRECNLGNYNIGILNEDIIPNVVNDLLKLTNEPDNLQNDEANKWVSDDDQLTVICANFNDPVKFLPNPPGTTTTPKLGAPLEQDESSITTQPPVIGCEECLEKLDAGLQEQLVSSIVSLSNNNPIIQVGDVKLDFTGITETVTLNDICNIIDAAVEANGPISLMEMISTFSDLLPGLDDEERAQVAEMISCQVKAQFLENDSGMI